MSNLQQRVITGFFFVVTLIGGMLWHPVSYGLLFLAITVLSLLEFYKLIKNSAWGIQPQMVQGIFAGALLFITFYADTFAPIGLPRSFIAINILSIIVIFISELYRKKENPFANIGFTLLGIFYLALPFALSTYLVKGELVPPKFYTSDERLYSELSTYKFYPWLIFGCFMIVWANDSWAYLGGRWLGKHKLFERISPGKTWEGSIVGGIVALGFAYLMSLFFDKYSVIDWLAIGAILVVTSTLGDLVESMLKRSLGVKDSGNMLPGHGGILDRFDGMYLAIPAIWAYLTLFA